MPDPTPVELTEALDRLVDTLEAAVAQNDTESIEVTEAVRACSRIARAHGVHPEAMIIALKPRLQRAAERVREKDRDEFLRAMVTLAIESYFMID